MQHIELAIVTWHQTYLSSYAGGYVRLREFLKRVPNKTDFVILDNYKSIYSDIVKKERIIEYKSPRWISNLQKKAFILWFLLETISSTVILYTKSAELIKKNNIRVLYFPTGEFLQLYTVSYLIKLRYPGVKVILDILNYGILDKNYQSYFKRLQKSGIGLVRAVVITITIWFSHMLMKYTIRHADYIFTVSREFMERIKKDYQKESINFTPSGVSLPGKQHFDKPKHYLGIYIGRMTVEKGIFELIAVWEKVVKQNKDAKLLLGGFADEAAKNAIKKDIIEKNLEKSITFIDSVSDELKSKLLSDSELFIHLAHREPLFPVITILEGWAHGLPTVFYDMSVYDSALKEFNFSTECLYPVANLNKSKAAELILAYSNLDEKTKATIQNNALKNAAMFSWDRIAKQEWDVINELIKS